ncbi:hypothetical protein ACFWDI_10985 [Streptomyces sp. NPDC060064]|uniref:MmyB family transcriptional regulator n=1 Tax=Streptomyces sp. NPDC060064 TaxID=3347049 RepID=UPI0036956DCB
MHALATSTSCSAVPPETPIAPFDAISRPARLRDLAQGSAGHAEQLRDLYTDWDAVAAEAVERLRMDAVHTPGDRRLADLVGELSFQDDDFCRLWGSHGVRSASTGRKCFRHPRVGPLELDWQAMAHRTPWHPVSRRAPLPRRMDRQSPGIGH